LFDKIKELYLLNIYKIANCADCLLPTADCKLATANWLLPTATWLLQTATRLLNAFLFSMNFTCEIVNKTNQYEKEK